MQAIAFLLLGGALQTPDSLVYLNIARVPFSNAGSWHPMGFPLFLFPFAKSPIAVLFGLALLSGICSALIWIWIANPNRRKRWNVLLWLALFLTPDFLMIHSAVWSETLFVTVAIAIALALDSELPRGPRICLVVLLSVYLALVRHAGLFLVPAICVGIAIGYRRRGAVISRKSFVGISMVSILVTALLVFSNLKGRVPDGEDSGIAKQACVQGIVALTPLDICRRGMAPHLCSLDPKGTWLSSSQVEYN